MTLLKMNGINTSNKNGPSGRIITIMITIRQKENSSLIQLDTE